jgi:hypothetical protein
VFVSKLLQSFDGEWNIVVNITLSIFGIDQHTDLLPVYVVFLCERRPEDQYERCYCQYDFSYISHLDKLLFLPCHCNDHRWLHRERLQCCVRMFPRHLVVEHEHPVAEHVSLAGLQRPVFVFGGRGVGARRNHFTQSVSFKIFITIRQEDWPIWCRSVSFSMLPE